MPTMLSNFFGVCVLVTQLCPTLCDSMDCSPPGSSVYGILQARKGELPFPSPGDLPNPGMEPRSPTLQANFLPSEPPEDKLFGNHLQKDHVLSPMNTWVSYPVIFELSFELIYLILSKISFYLEVKKIVLLRSVNQPAIKMQWGCTMCQALS